MSDLRTILERGVGGATPPPDGFERMLGRRDRKRRNQRIAAGVVGIAVFAAAVWVVTSGLSLDRSTPAVSGSTKTGAAETAAKVTDVDRLLNIETGKVTPLAEVMVGLDDSTSEYAVSPNGSKIAYVRSVDTGGNQIFVANLDGTGAQQVTNVFDARMPAWSPDGSMIAYIGRRGHGHRNVFVQDLATGASTQLTFDRSLLGPISTPSFTSDGSSVVYELYGRGIRMVPTLGGTSELLVRDGSEPQLSPDGSLLSYICAAGIDVRTREGICLANPDGTDARALVVRSLVAGGARWSPDGKRIAYWELGPGDLDARWQKVLVVDVATGEVTQVAVGGRPAWIDDHTLIVEGLR